MRNPIRLKNLRWRFLPYYAAAVLCIFLVTPRPGPFVAGALFVILGAALRTWGAGHLVKNDQLTVSGPYSWLRHPLYAGTLLTGVGFAVILGGWWSAAILCFLLPWFFLHYYPRKERNESGRLEEIYGPDFRCYRDSVRALVPGLRPWRPEPGRLVRADPRLRWSADRYSENNELGTLIAQLAGLGVLAARTGWPS